MVRTGHTSCTSLYAHSRLAVYSFLLARRKASTRLATSSKTCVGVLVATGTCMRCNKLGTLCCWVCGHHLMGLWALQR